jgi:hypothetical protein
MKRARQRSNAKVPLLMRLGILLPVLAVLAGPTAQPAVALEAAPSWKISAISYPTLFAPGPLSSSEGVPGYSVIVRNVGGEATSGKITVKNTLPSAVSFSSEEPVRAVIGRAAAGLELPCKKSGKSLTCSTSQPLPPGEVLVLKIPVAVAPTATGVLTDTVEVEGGNASIATASVETEVSNLESPFGFLSGAQGLAAMLRQADGSVATQAGSHPYELDVTFELPVNPSHFRGPETIRAPDGGLKDIEVDLPRGLVVNPGATPVKCKEVQLETEKCPPGSQVGSMVANLALSSYPTRPTIALFNMQAPSGVPALLGANVIEGVYIHLLGHVRSDGDYGLSARVNTLPSRIGLLGAETSLWGVPSDPSHDELRAACYKSSQFGEDCEVERTGTPFLTAPSECGGPQAASATIASYGSPGKPVARQAAMPAIVGCNKLEFHPTISAKPTTTTADSPSGLDFNLHQPQNEDTEGLSPANLKDTEVTLPQGLVLNPAAGAGLASCSSAQIGLASATGQSADIRFTDAPQTCPSEAKLGLVEIDTPLLDHPLPGTVYLAKPFDNPFDSLVAIYLAVEDEQSGIVAKLAGRVEPDPSSGQLTTTFSESPELPLEDVDLHLFGGARGSLTTPLSCGTYSTTARLTPWSSPEGADAIVSDSFATSGSADGGTCPTADSAASNTRSFTAGTISPQAATFSPFVLSLTRPDGSQRFGEIDALLPDGLTGKLAGIPYCSESDIARAQGRSNPQEGVLEKEAPSCPAASEVGTVTVGAGSGPTQLYVQGHAYLAGPYKGAPLSMVIITPAVAGPFDLGAVVVRTAFYVNPETARIHAVSDPLPTILQGIPLDVRSIRLALERPSFTINPTSCDPMSILGSVTSTTGQVATVSSPFQVGGCSALAFKPRLSLRLKGGTKRSANPALSATVTMPAGQTNFKGASVALPHSEFLEQAHIRTICTRVQFAEGSVPGEKCPAGSIYGRATAKTPLLADPLSGSVYLRSSAHPLPDLVVALHGQVDVVLVGRIDSVRGGIRTTFENVPDAPVSSFTLNMAGGRKSLIVNSTDICRRTYRATAVFDGQNGKRSEQRPAIKAKCKSSHRRKHPKS